LKFDPIVGVPAAVRDSSALMECDLQARNPSAKQSWRTWLRMRSNPSTAKTRLPLTQVLPGELTLIYRAFSAGVGIEVLGGDGVKGFTTPLATLP